MFRYDCRGHLYRLEDFDFSKEKSYQELSTEEVDVENICDEERYKDLDKDMIEEEILEGERYLFCFSHYGCCFQIVFSLPHQQLYVICYFFHSV